MVGLDHNGDQGRLGAERAGEKKESEQGSHRPDSVQVFQRGQDDLQEAEGADADGGLLDHGLFHRSQADLQSGKVARPSFLFGLGIGHQPSHLCLKNGHALSNRIRHLGEATSRQRWRRYGVRVNTATDIGLDILHRLRVPPCGDMGWSLRDSP